MLVFQTPHPLGQLAKRLLVAVFSGALSSAKPACPTPPQHPIPAKSDFYLLDYAGITQKFWRNHRVQSLFANRQDRSHV